MREYLSDIVPLWEVIPAKW